MIHRNWTDARVGVCMLQCTQPPSYLQLIRVTKMIIAVCKQPRVMPSMGVLAIIVPPTTPHFLQRNGRVADSRG